MTIISPEAVRQTLLTRGEIAIFDLRDEHVFAQGHPLFAAQLPVERIVVEAAVRVPRKDTLVVLYDDGEGLVRRGAEAFDALGYRDVRILQNGEASGLQSWRDAGYELFQDVNSYSKAFGELVEQRRHTPSLSADEVHALIEQSADIAILDARRFDEYATMSIPTATSVPGAELVLRAPALAPDPGTTIIVNCAGRTRSLIGTQSLINAGLPNQVVALRNGTIGWTLAGKTLARGQQRRAPDTAADADQARQRARDVSYRAGVAHIDGDILDLLASEVTRTLYRFDVRTPEEYAAGHLPVFLSAPGGQLVQETDHWAPVRGARIVLSDDIGTRADMTASWLAQMGWEVYVLDAPPGAVLESGGEPPYPARGPEGRYRRPYEGTAHAAEAMQAYLDWEYGLVAQLARDGTHGFYVI